LRTSLQPPAYPPVRDGQPQCWEGGPPPAAGLQAAPLHTCLPPPMGSLPLPRPPIFLVALCQVTNPPLPSAFDPEPSILCPLPSRDVVLASLTGPKPDFACSSLSGKWLFARLPR
ncbi:Hypothetical predicted protein, partial [Lynx pardinus]